MKGRINFNRFASAGRKDMKIRIGENCYPQYIKEKVGGMSVTVQN